ncbi:iron complex outermembrane receptor protein [Polaromonas sp. CG_9.5]|uniref:TonB-dependent receptor family protein n=1 Tax=Polaromonas sp. CG_9.5 TaxID=3071705 RepID=UPI002E0AEEFC|nr:iron complex outermembrane receptor protein [Polaromonas sp. CG_9.5]
MKSFTISASSLPSVSEKTPSAALAPPVFSRHGVAQAAAAWLATALLAPSAQAQDQPGPSLKEVVISASRAEQRRFDAPGAIDAVQVDPFRTASPLVNLSELMGSVPGLQIRDRQNFAQDLQVSVRGFGTRSTFGVRGVRILVDGIPATMPDGQGQAATASLTSAKRIELLRGPLAQLYGNAAGGVLQVFTKNPPVTPDKPEYSLSAGVGSDGQRHIAAGMAGGSDTLGGLLDVSRYSTDGFRDHSAARREQLNAKVVAKPSADTTITGIVNLFRQPLAEDPLGLTRSQFQQNPRQVVPGAITFNTRKTIEQSQAGLVVEHKLTASDTLNARVYGGTRQVDQKLAFQTNGVVNLDRSYGGVGASWTHAMQVNQLPVRWTVGVEADQLRETRKGFDNIAGNNGPLRRNEDDTARNNDVFGQIDWTFSPDWQAIAGVRASRVKFSVDDRFNPAAKSTSGRVEYRNTSPVIGLVWHAAETLNVYANLGTGFETPTLAESAYRPGGAPGPNFALKPSKSTQGEVGVKLRSGPHSFDAALFEAQSKDEIVSSLSSGGRAVFQNADKTTRRGLEASWSAHWAGGLDTRLAYTLLDARFESAYAGAQGPVPAGNRLPGAPRHSLFADVQASLTESVKAGLETRLESKTWVNDLNADAAPGYTVFNASLSREFRFNGAKLLVYGRIDNLLDKAYAGSLIVNDNNGRYFEAAPGRRLFVGVRSVF